MYNLKETDKKEKKSKKKDVMKFKEFDPSQYIETEPTLKEAKSDTVVFSFGRMNPVTIGHEKLVNKVKSVAKSMSADSRVYLSHTQNNQKDPLSYKDKYRFARKAFGPIIIQSKARQVFQIAAELEKAGYKNIVMVVGSDRVEEFKRILDKYNGKDYDFASIKVVSAGARDPDADGVEGMSGTKLRGIAQKGQFDDYTDEKGKKQFGFKSAAASKLSDKDKMAMMKLVQKNLAEAELQEALTRQQRMQRARTFRRIKHKIKKGRERAARKRAGIDKLQKRAAKGARNLLKKKMTKGQDYKQMSYGQRQQVDNRLKKVSPARLKALSKRLLPSVKKKEMERIKNRNNKSEGVAQDRQVKDMPGTQPKKYYSGLDKKDKESRARQFARQAKMSDDDPRAYKPAPGDKEAKTKPSKHTKKFQQMYGEADAVAAARERIKREKQSDKDKHDAMMDRARTQDTRSKNQKTEAISPAQQAAIAIAKKAKGQKPKNEDDDPCWDTHKQVGMKKKGGKMVPDCVPKNESIAEEVSQKQINDLEKFADRILAKFKIDVEFTKHFVDRMNDKRNTPEIKVAELQKLFKKIQKNKGKDVKDNEGIEAVLKDLSSDLNLPVVIKTKGDEIELVNKTIMRKKDFKTPSKVIKYEQFSNMDEASRADMRVRKRPHMMLKAGNAGVKFDGRFKMYKKKQVLKDEEKPLEESFESMENMIFDLMESTEAVIAEDSGEALKKKAEKSGMPLGILKKVFDRGVAAWRTGHRPGTTATQWGLARVNSFVTKSKGTWGKADSDLAAKVRKESVDEEKELEKILTTDGRMKSFKEKLRKLGYKKIDEGKSSSGYELYHNDFSSAMKHAYKHAKDKLKVDIDPNEIDDKVATGPRKPSKGKTNSYRLTDKSGKKAVQIQVYNMDGKKYELNMYKEDLDEAPRRKRAPKMTGDSIAIQRAKDAELNKALGRTKTGRKKPVRKMTSTQRSLASLRGEEVENIDDQFDAIIKEAESNKKSYGDLVVELTAAEKKLVNQMYDKKGNLTPLGKKVMNHGKKKGDKGYVESVETLEEGVNDPGIFKAVFLAGGPGSGKSFMVGKTALTSMGLKLINSDPAFEAQLKKVDLKPTPEDIFTAKGQDARAKAKALTDKKQALALAGRLGLVIDGTGKDYEKIANQAMSLKKLGYEVGMIFVNTNLETAISRDEKRSRTLGAKEVTNMWNAVQNNIGKFSSLFGGNMQIVDNSEGADFEKGATKAYKQMKKWVAKDPKSPMAKKWIASVKAQRGITEDDLGKMINSMVEGKDQEDLSKTASLFEKDIVMVREGLDVKESKVLELGKPETTKKYKTETPGEKPTTEPQRFSQRIRENILRNQRRK